MVPSYNPDLYVSRTHYEQQILQWLSDPQQSLRIWSIIGSPGAGKSWLLEDLREQLRDAFSADSTKHFVIWLKARSLTSSGGTKLDNKLVDKWIEKQVSDPLNGSGIRVRPPAIGASRLENLRQVAQDLTGHKCVLLIDEFEEVDLALQDAIIEICVELLSNSEMRIVATMRDDESRFFNEFFLKLEKMETEKLGMPLKEDFSVFAKDMWSRRATRLSQIWTQIQRKQSTLSDNSSEIRYILGIKGAIKHKVLGDSQVDKQEIDTIIDNEIMYGWSSPYINGLLFGQIARASKRMIQHRNYIACLKSYLARATPDYAADTLALLKVLPAKFEESLLKKIGVEHSRLTPLLKEGVLHQSSTHGFYEVDPVVRQLIVGANEDGGQG